MSTKPKKQQNGDQLNDRKEIEETEQKVVKGERIAKY
jgi:hypothetical protein